MDYNECNDESKNQSLTTNKSKTKVMMKNSTPIYVNINQIENVESYVYQGQIYSISKKGDSKKRHGRMDSSRPIPRHIQEYHLNIL